MRNFFFILFLIGSAFLSARVLDIPAGVWREDNAIASEDLQYGLKTGSINADGQIFIVSSRTETIGELLEEQHIVLSEKDSVFPSTTSKWYTGTTVIIRRAKRVTLTVGEEKKSIVTFLTQRNDLLAENNIVLGDEDRIMPQGDEIIHDGMSLTIVRVEASEVVLDRVIAFETIEKEDDTIAWNTTLVQQEGRTGKERLTYLRVTHNGKEVEKKLQKKEILEEPVNKQIIQGTKIKVGKIHTGLGTWYAYTGTLSAASPWLPMGSFVRVTNQDNGKQVIVTINDRGPFGKNRILDLDKVAFAKIASIGAGVIPLKVEEILP